MFISRTCVAVVACWLAAVAAAWCDPPAGQSQATNLALHKPTSQSSTYSGTGLSQSSDLGVDGVIAPDKDPKFMFHTTLEANPWWQVDLGTVAAIAAVHLHNRTSAATPEVAARARTVQLLLSSDGAAWTRAYQHDGKPFAVLHLALQNARARYVRIQLAERNYLHMYEVEVYGPVANAAAAPLKPAAPSANPLPTKPVTGTQWYTHPTGAYRFQLPPGWRESKVSNEIVRHFGPTTGGPEAILLDGQEEEYSGPVERRMGQLETQRLYGLREPRKSERLTLGGAPALLVSGRSKGSENMLWELAVFGRGTIHDLTVWGPPGSKGTTALKLLLSSFELLGEAAATAGAGAAPPANDAAADEPGPPSGLDPLPPEPAGPPALPPNPLPPVPAGRRLVQATVGATGGTVAAPGAVTLVFPAGALTRNETITIATGPALGGARLYDITRTGQGVMPKPVQLTFKLPPGVKAGEALPVHELAPGVYEAPRFRYDPATQTLTTEINHCSTVGITLPILIVAGVAYVTGAGDRLVAPLTRYATAENVARGFAALVGALGGGFAAKSVGLAVLGVPGLGIVVGVVGGAYSASRVLTAAHDAYLRMDLVGPMPVGKFNVYWPGEAQPQEPAVWVALGNQQIVGLVGPDAFAPSMRASVPFTFPGLAETYLFPNLRFVRLPASVLTVMERLQYADRWYDLNRMPVPTGPIDVVIRPWKGQVVGESYNGAIHLNANALGGEAATGGAMDAIIAHELFHLICAGQGWAERRFVGSEDSLCVAMETQVFPHVTAFQEYSWMFALPTLRNGLVREGPNEAAAAPARRGYYLWPWTHYLAYSYGVPALREYVTNTTPDDALAQRFRNFCYSVIASNRALRDPLTVSGVPARTGWALAGRDLDQLAAATMGSSTATLPLGASNLRAFRPLSLALPVFSVPREPKGILVIRRDWPEETEEYVAIRPTAGRETQTLPADRTTADMLTMKGGIALRGPWVDSQTFKDVLPVAVICTATSQQGAPQTDARLIAYRLNAPTGITMTKQQGQPTRLSWTLPATGCTLPLNDCLSSYRVFGKTKNNTDQLIAELYFDVPQTQLKQFGGKALLSITPGQTEITFPAASTEQYVAMGMQSVEKALKYPSGKQVMSEIAWSPYACTIAISPNPFEVTAGRQMVFDARADFPPKGARYRWSSTGRVTRDGLESAPVQFDTEGPASVTVTLCDAAGKTLCVATAVGRVKKKEAPPEQPDVDKPADDNAPAHGVWRLVKREVSPTGDTGHHKYAIGGTKADCRNMHLEENRIIYQCLHSWSAPPATIVPDQEYTMRLTAQSVVFPEGEAHVTTTICGGSSVTETQVRSPQGSTAAAAGQVRFKAGRGAPGAQYALWVGGTGGWMNWRVSYVYEWTP